MKKYVYLILFVLLIFILYTSLKSFQKKKVDKDYEKIETVKTAMEELVATSAVSSLGSDQGQWYIFDLRVLKDHNETFYVELSKKLGKDFDSKLSNGDYIFVGVYPLRRSYRIYAGDPADSDSMLYPEWKYTRLKQK